MPTSITDQEFAELKLGQSQFRQFRDLIYKQTGISLADNKIEFIQNRLSKRLRANQLTSFKDYFVLLANNPDGEEMQQMINRITTNKTHFFREMHHFEYLRDTLFRRVIQEAEQGQRKKKLRIWCAASSTGEEPYSLAITVYDTFSKLRGWDTRILASDIDTSVLQKAQAAVFTMSQALEVPPETLKQHFHEVDDPTTSDESIEVRSPAKELVTFRQVNLLGGDWPIHCKFDAIFCRNVLIYFDQPTQDKLMRKMSNYLAPDGNLFIGHSESLSTLNDVYHRVGKTIYELVTPNGNSSSKPAGIRNRNQANAGQSQAKPPQKKTATGKIKRIVIGDVCSSNTPQRISTVLGSCVAVCLHDPVARIGGMNHFALPSASDSTRAAASFGVHAMELLINQLMVRGADRGRLQAKVFGGADVINADQGDQGIGRRNAEFIREFLSTEGIPMVSEYLGGERGMQVLFDTGNGRVKLKLLDREKALRADQEVQKTISAAPAEPVSDITLF